MTISGAPTTAVYGTPINLAGSLNPVNAESGTATYTWLVNNTAVATGTSTAAQNYSFNYSFTPAQVGSYTVTLNVTDAAGDTGTTSVTFGVTQAPLTAAAVSVTDNGGVYDFAQYPVTAATVTGVAATARSPASATVSLSYTYYDAATSTSLGSTAPTNAGSYTVVATFAGDTDYPRPTARPWTSASRQAARPA